MAISTLRAPRRTDEFLLPKQQTLDHVAPGTYSNTHNEPNSGSGEAIVPFSSLQEKVLNPNKGGSAFTPGPGAYVGPRVRNGTGTKANGDEHLGVGSTSMKAKSRRMAPTAPGSSVYTASTIAKNPGPGAYETESDLLAAKLPRDLINPVKPVLEAHEKTTPSMPLQKLGPNQRPEQDSSGGVGDVSHLYMRHTGEPKDMVGPGEYDPKGDHLTQRNLPQTIFHSSKCSRNLWEPSSAIGNTVPPKEIPGPGSYDIRGAKGELQPVDSLNEVVKSCQFASNSLMAHQITLSPEKVIPGPGQYEIQGDIEKTVQSARDRIGSHGAHFGGMSERIGWARDPAQPFKDPYNIHHVPGPGQYTKIGSDFPTDPKKKEVEKVLPTARKKKFYGVHHPSLVMALQEATGPLQAFNSTDDRQCNKEVDQKTPAPWQYNHEEARAHSMNADLRERAKVGRKGAFGTRADRFYGSPLEGRAGLPDFSSFEEKGPGNNAEPRSMFQSQSPRFHSAPGPREANAVKVGNAETPAPGDYIVEKEPSYRSPFRSARTEHLSFGSSKQRFEGAKDVFVGHTRGLLNPGPGEYVATPRKRVTGGASLKDKRKPPIVGCTTQAVGPGSYGDGVTSHMLRKTFNVSTQVPMDAVSSRRPPMDSFSF